MSWSQKTGCSTPNISKKSILETCFKASSLKEMNLRVIWQPSKTMKTVKCCTKLSLKAVKTSMNLYVMRSSMLPCCPTSSAEAFRSSRISECNKFKRANLNNPRTRSKRASMSKSTNPQPTKKSSQTSKTSSRSPIPWRFPTSNVSPAW